MPAYRGKDLAVVFDTQDVSGDGRSVSFEESGDALDSTTVGMAAREKIAGLTDGSASFEAIDTTGAWAAEWQSMKPGTAGTLDVYPEGNSSGMRKVSAAAIVTARSLSVPYDDVSTVSVSFELSGTVTESTVP